MQRYFVFLILLTILPFCLAQKCMIGWKIMELNPDTSVCKPYLKSNEYYFQSTSINTTGLLYFYHASLSGISAGIVGQACKEDGLSFFCAAVLLECVPVPLAQTPWPSFVWLPKPPCYDPCLKAKKSCEETQLAESINCDALETDVLSVPELKATVPCNREAASPSNYSDVELACPDFLAYDERQVSCGLACTGTDYPNGARYALIVTSGWIMVIVALNCLYLMPPLFHKALKEPFFREARVSNGPTRMVSGKLQFMFILNLFIYTFSWTPYIIVPGDWIWCTTGVFGRALDNPYVAVMGFISVSSNMAYRGYWFLMLVDMWLSMLGRSVTGGPYLWTFLMIIPFLWGYPPMIYAWASNNITTVPSVHTIAYLVDTYVPYLKMSVVDIPLTVVTVASIPFIAHIAFLFYRWHKTNKGSKITSRYYYYIKMCLWYTIYEIPSMMVVIFFWNLRGHNDQIAKGYEDQITCSISNIDSSICTNSGLQSVAWLMFIGIFGLCTLLPVGPVMGYGSKNGIYLWWKKLFANGKLPNAPDVSTTRGSSGSGSS